MYKLNPRVQMDRRSTVRRNKLCGVLFDVQALKNF